MSPVRYHRLRDEESWQLTLDTTHYSPSFLLARDWAHEKALDDAMHSVRVARSARRDGMEKG